MKILKPWNDSCVSIIIKTFVMKTNIQTLRTNKVRKAQLKLSKHRELGTDSPIDIHEVASLMDMVKNRSNVENESLMFSIHMN